MTPSICRVIATGHGRSTNELYDHAILLRARLGLDRFATADNMPTWPTVGQLQQFGIPAEYASRPFEDALDYLESIARSGASKVYRAKIILLGDGGAGKTSLVKRLVHDDFDPHQPMTDGIDFGMLWTMVHSQRNCCHSLVCQMMTDRGLDD